MLPLSHAADVGVAEAGGKACSLAELLKIAEDSARSGAAAFAVPSGCVVTASCFESHVGPALGRLAAEVPASADASVLAQARATVAALALDPELTAALTAFVTSEAAQGSFR